MKFSEKIRTERIKNNLTQQQLADKLGVALRTITSYETQDKYPKNKKFILNFQKFSRLI